MDEKMKRALRIKQKKRAERQKYLTIMKRENGNGRKKIRKGSPDGNIEDNFEFEW
uniref:Uncharacterized protein n=1 Tax=viral metagenome TaxID=1070528 RepID=A0A6M3L2F5_9ZZZZ